MLKILYCLQYLVEFFLVGCKTIALSADQTTVSLLELIECSKEPLDISLQKLLALVPLCINSDVVHPQDTLYFLLCNRLVSLNYFFDQSEFEVELPACFFDCRS